MLVTNIKVCLSLSFIASLNSLYYTAFYVKRIILILAKIKPVTNILAPETQKNVSANSQRVLASFERSQALSLLPPPEMWRNGIMTNGCHIKFNVVPEAIFGRCSG